MLSGDVWFFDFPLGCIVIKRHNFLFLAAAPATTTAAAVESCDYSKENEGSSSDTEPPDGCTLVKEELLPDGVGSANNLVWELGRGVIYAIQFGFGVEHNDSSILNGYAVGGAKRGGGVGLDSSSHIVSIVSFIDVEVAMISLVNPDFEIGRLNVSKFRRL